MNTSLHALLACLEHNVQAIQGPDPRTIQVTGIAYDSRKIEPGNLFVAVCGHVTDGHRFLSAAIDAGASACIVEHDDALPSSPRPVTFVTVTSARRALALSSSCFYDWPGRTLQMIGVTGTNGKTTTTFLVEALLRGAGRHPGLIGTIETRIGHTRREAQNTTPESLDLQRLLFEMREVGHDSAVMEVSSHALALDRVVGCRFAGAIFTNLTQDHLDFHHSMEAYRAAKQRLFRDLEPEAVAIVNADDPSSSAMRETRARTWTCGIEADADVRASAITYEADCTRFKLTTRSETVDVKTRLLGRFNVYNVLGALALGVAMDIPLATLVDTLQHVPPIPGRFEAVYEGQPFPVIVDYAHTPDGLRNILEAARPLTRNRLITVFGCGGNRDRGKRPQMGSIAETLSDRVYVTSDNPRFEDPNAIIDDIVRGMGRPARVELDRKRAIETALSDASAGDCVVIAGKGHETTQEINGVKYPFHDVEIARTALKCTRSI